MFACPDCGREFQKRNGLVLHQRSKHPTPEERILVDDEYSPDPPDLSIVQGEAEVFQGEPEVFVDGIELVEDDGASLMRHPERAAARARELREQAQAVNAIAGQDQRGVSLVPDGTPPLLAAVKAAGYEMTPVRLVADDPMVPSPDVEAAMVSQAMAAHPNPQAPLTRRHFDQVKFRVKEGPDVQDVMWLVKMLDLADEILQIAARPHVLDRWNQALSE